MWAVASAGALSMASCPTSGVRAAAWVLGCDRAGTAERSYPASEVRSRPGGATLQPRSRAASQRSCPTSEEGQGRWPRGYPSLRLRRDPRGAAPRPEGQGVARRSNPTSRSGGCAGAGPKRASHSEGQEGHQEGDTPHPEQGAAAPWSSHERDIQLAVKKPK